MVEIWKFFGLFPFKIERKEFFVLSKKLSARSFCRSGWFSLLKKPYSSVLVTMVEIWKMFGQIHVQANHYFLWYLLCQRLHFHPHHCCWNNSQKSHKETKMCKSITVSSLHFFIRGRITITDRQKRYKNQNNQKESKIFRKESVMVQLNCTDMELAEWY